MRRSRGSQPRSNVEAANSVETWPGSPEWAHTRLFPTEKPQSYSYRDEVWQFASGCPPSDRIVQQVIKAVNRQSHSTPGYIFISSIANAKHLMTFQHDQLSLGQRSR